MLKVQQNLIIKTKKIHKKMTHLQVKVKINKQNKLSQVKKA
jgi:hypothetical protein